MAVTIEEAKAFIKDAEKARSPWYDLAKRSWGELKKRQRDNRLWNISPNSLKKRARYPAWYSIYKIRQPLLLSRIGIPIGKDTTQDGNDNVGATAAICLERLAVNLARSFDFFDVMCAARDDFLATCFGLVRAYYERDEVKEKVKERIAPQKLPNGDVVFVDGAGKIVESDDIGQDDEGFFLEHNQTVDIENERICLEPVLYRCAYIDPDIRRWNRCKRLAFEEMYSEVEFKNIFGVAAFNALPKPEQTDSPDNDDASTKRKRIKVYEYWDLYERDVYWFAEEGEDFIKPKGYMLPDDAEYEEQLNGLYDLEGFFPVPPPLVINQATDEFWPIPEFYQVYELIEDIHTIFSRMMALTRSIRSRLLFDNSIDSLQALVNEASEGDAIGVPNLAQSLTTAGGSLANAVQYLPIKECIEGLNNLYIALENRLGILFRITGTNDLLQGLTQDNSGKTLGERQMEEKYAVNQIAEAQRKMQEFVRDCYQLMCEMALKNFKDASLDRYIMPLTLPKEHQERYRAAIGMLKEHTKRFRVELETDSTIALNEQYDKAMRIEIVNALTAALEKTANIAQTSPALIVPELHCLKFLVQGFRQGKIFQNEITQAIDNTIKQAEAAPEPFNKDESDAQIKGQELMMKDRELQAKFKLDTFKIQSDAQLASVRLRQEGQLAMVQAQLEQLRLGAENQKTGANLQLEYQKLGAAIREAQEKLLLERDTLILEYRKVASAEELEAYKAQLDTQFKPLEAQLRAQELALEAREQEIDKLRVAADVRINEMEYEHMLGEMALKDKAQKIEVAALQHEMTKPPELPPITINMPEPKTKKKKVELKQDKFGNIKSLKAQDIEEATE